jgi:hypothetical protein
MFIAVFDGCAAFDLAELPRNVFAVGKAHFQRNLKNRHVGFDEFLRELFDAKIEDVLVNRIARNVLETLL